jgi:hypothetical protein
VRVEVLDIPAQHDVEVAWSRSVGGRAFSAQSADEPFRDRIRPRCPDRGADDADVDAGVYGVEGGGELAIPVADQESLGCCCDTRSPELAGHRWAGEQEGPLARGAATVRLVERAKAWAAAHSDG